MEDRYPYIRFVIDAAQVIAGAVAIVVFFGGTVSACSRGGFGGFVSFVVTILIAGVTYVAVMIEVEILRVFLDIESATRQLLAAANRPAAPTASTPAA